MFKNKEDQNTFILDNYEDVTESKIDESHWDLYCDECKLVRGFQVTEISQTVNTTQYGVRVDWKYPVTYYFRCPVCDAYKLWIIFRAQITITDDEEVEKKFYRYFKVTSLPNEGIEDIDELPEEPKSLRIAYKQAIRCMDANAHIASATMFRRALQVITRDILKAKSGNLATELKSLVGKDYNGVKISKDFSDNAYIIKEVGNQASHPDNDSDLLNFTIDDAQNLQLIFMEIVSDLFVVPEAIKKTKENFLSKRKIVNRKNVQ